MKDAFSFFGPSVLRAQALQGKNNENDNRIALFIRAPPRLGDIGWVCESSQVVP